MQVLYIDTSHLSNEVVATFVQTVSHFRDIKCDLSPFDVDNIRKRKPLLIWVCGAHKCEVTSLFTYDDLAQFGKDGYMLNSAKDLNDFADRLANDFRYF